MADRRRRRALEDEGEESAPLAGDDERKGRPSECESEGEPVDTDVISEYESATEDSRAELGEESEEGSEEEEEEETEEETEEGSEEEEEYTDEDVIVEGDHIEEERQSGDGEEQPDKENVDDDEDKKNPAYVPRKGAFYEHDLRTGEEQGPEPELKPKKKLWQDEGKWSHDRYHEDLQAPKSRDELIAIYGYDIRASDKPPDAPPRRKLGSKRSGHPSERKAQLQDYLKPTRPPPQPQRQPQQRMAIIDTTDYGVKQRTRPPPTESFDYDEIIDVPYMTTIDTTESSADSYRSAHRSHGGPRQGRDNRQSYNNRAGRGRGTRAQNANSQDGYGVHSDDQDSRVHSNQSQESQDYRQQGYRSQDYRSREPRGQGEGRHRNSYNRFKDDQVSREEDLAERSSYNQLRNSSRGNRSQFGRSSRGRERSDYPPRYSKAQNETVAKCPPYDVTAREFTNSSYTNSAAPYKSTPEEGKTGQISPAGAADGKGRQTSQDVIISNKENVQTISVTITNTTTERKSYAKERRGKTSAARGNAQNPAGEAPALGEKKKQILEASPEQDLDSSKQGSEGQPGGEGIQPRQDYREQTRPKRYSSQRQRNVPESSYPDQPVMEQKPALPTSTNAGPAFFNQAVYPRGPPFYPSDQPGSSARPPRPPPPSQDAASFGAPILQPFNPLHLPVSSQTMPSPPRLFGPQPAGAPPPPVPISSAAPPLLAAPYLAAPGVIYSAPPPPGAPAPYQIPLGYTSPPPAAPPPAALAQPPVASPPQTQSEVYRGGTTYYPPYLQQPPSRSPARRPKVAIPIVDPLEAKRKSSQAEPAELMEELIADMQQPVEQLDQTQPQVVPKHPQESATCLQDNTVPEKSVSPLPPHPVVPSSHQSAVSLSVDTAGSRDMGLGLTEKAVSPADENRTIHQSNVSPSEAYPAPSSPSHISAKSSGVRSKAMLTDVQPAGGKISESSSVTGVGNVQSQAEPEVVQSS